MGGLPAEGWPAAVSVPILVLVLVGGRFWLVLVCGGSESNVVGDRGA